MIINPNTQITVSWVSNCPINTGMHFNPHIGRWKKKLILPLITNQTIKPIKITFINDLKNSSKFLSENIFFAPAIGLICLISGFKDEGLSKKPN